MSCFLTCFIKIISQSFYEKGKGFLLHSFDKESVRHSLYLTSVFLTEMLIICYIKEMTHLLFTY